ncbi:MAG: hypothetical protein R3F61_28570 [Myxococcota bacterium]
MLLSLLIACGPSGPTADSTVRGRVLEHLEARYGEPFTVDHTEHKGRGLEGLDADGHSFVAWPTARPEQRFEGRVDLDLEPVRWMEDYLCLRDAEASDTAAHEAAKQPGTKPLDTTSTCNRDRLAEVDPRAPLAAFDWVVRLATFGPEVEAAADPLHSAIGQAANDAGARLVESRVFVYERGQDTILHFGDAPIPPPVAMWYVGSSQRVAESPAVVRQKQRAPGVEAELRVLAEAGLPAGRLDVRVVADDEDVAARIAANPDVGFDALTPDQRQGLSGWIQLAVVGTPDERGDEVRTWIQHTFDSLPRSRFLPMITVSFFASAEPGRPLSTQPDAQQEVWMYSGSVGLRIRANGIAGIEPITAIRYVVPGD